MAYAFLTKHVFDVPRLDKKAIDADVSAWGDSGFRVNLLARKSGPERTVEQFDPTFRLAWNKMGLLLLAIVRDISPVEHESIEHLYRMDSIEVVVSAGVDSGNRYQVVIAPGVDGKQSGPRMRVYDRRDLALSGEPLRVEPVCASRKTHDGYVVEVLLPLPWGASSGQSAINVVFNDAAAGETTAPSRYSWFPADTSSADALAMYALRFTDRASEPVQAAISRTEIERFRRLRLFVLLRNDQQEKTKQITVLGGRKVATVDIEMQPGLREFPITLPMPTVAQPYDGLVLMADGKVLTPVPVEDIYRVRRRAFFYSDFAPQKSVFFEETFPRLDFISPNAVEDMGGQYTVQTRYFDADYNEVTKPSKPGRYGAISVVTATEIGSATFYRTLYRTAKPYQYYIPARFEVEFPAAFGLDPAVVKARQPDVDRYFSRNVLHKHVQGDDRLAALLCGLAEGNAGDQPVARLGPVARDHQWWYGLKKKLGLPTGYPYAVELPKGYETDQESRWPLLVNLHGSSDYGEEFCGEQKTWRFESGIPSFAHKTGQRFIVVMPHNTNWEVGWKPIQMLDVLNEICAKYRVDPDRIYLMGSSMGGFGTWATAAMYPEKFAAIAPVCGIGDAADMGRLKEVPTWVIHGEQDPAVPIGPDKECVEALGKAGGRVRVTYTNQGHNVSIPPALYDWFLEQRRGEPKQARGIEAK